MSEKNEPFPTNDERSFGYSVAKVALGAVPIVGGAAQEFLDKAVGDPLRKRQEVWLAELGNGLAALSERVHGLSPERLADDPAFVTAAAQATQDALRTHSEIKREALKNTVLNVAAGVRLDDVLLGSFIEYINRFSEAHLKLLALLRDPMSDAAYAREAQNVSMGSVHGIVARAHPDIASQPDLLDRLHGDLSREGLAQGSFKAMMTGGGLRNPQTTAIGNAFLDFIAPPEPLERS
jgi:hypothetical protein